jgi:hypothetical protein
MIKGDTFISCLKVAYIIMCISIFHVKNRLPNDFANVTNLKERTHWLNPILDYSFKYCQICVVMHIRVVLQTVA